MEGQNVKTTADVRQFLKDQRTKYSDEVRSIPNAELFLTPEGIDRQLSETRTFPTKLVWYEITSREHDMISINIHRLELTKEQVGAAGA